MIMIIMTRNNNHSNIQEMFDVTYITINTLPFHGPFSSYVIKKFEMSFCIVLGISSQVKWVLTDWKKMHNNKALLCRLVLTRNKIWLCYKKLQDLKNKILQVPLASHVMIIFKPFYHPTYSSTSVSTIPHALFGNKLTDLVEGWIAFFDPVQTRPKRKKVNSKQALLDICTHVPFFVMIASRDPLLDETSSYKLLQKIFFTFGLDGGSRNFFVFKFICDGVTFSRSIIATLFFSVLGCR